MPEKDSIMLAYTGGLDAAVSLHWLKSRGHHVVTFTGDIGQEEDLDFVRESALSNGAGRPEDVVIVDLKRPFVTGFIWPAVRANAIYEGKYMLGGALPKPLLARTQAEAARGKMITTLAHGATSRQNDNRRFRDNYRIFYPGCKILVPWEDPGFTEDFKSREDLLEYKGQHNLKSSTSSSRPWTTERHLHHTSFEDVDLADFYHDTRDDMLRITPHLAPDRETYMEITFQDGTPIYVFHNDQGYSDPVEILRLLNRLGEENGIGMADIVETNLDGSKTRGVYVTPGGTILRVAHMDIEGATMSGKDIRKRDTLVPEFSGRIYAGEWYTDEMRRMRDRMDGYQKGVSGIANIGLYKGNVMVKGRTV